MKRMRIVSSVASITILAGCAYLSRDESRHLGPVKHVLQIHHESSYEPRGQHKAYGWHDRWEFKDGHKAAALRGYGLGTQDVVEWHATNKFWLHVTLDNNSPIDWSLCTNGISWIPGAALPCPFNGANDLGMMATQGPADWALSLRFPANALRQPFKDAPYRVIMSEVQENTTRSLASSATPTATTPYYCNLVVEATLVWESRDAQTNSVKANLESHP